MVFAVSGSSGSGKSFIVRYILKKIGSNLVSVIYQDNYYKRRDEQPKDKNGKHNFDLPSSFHLDEFMNDINKIRNGEKLVREEYTYNNPKISPKEITVLPKKIIIVEGLFLFHERNLSDLFDKKILIDTKPSIMIKRRIKRDVEIRGYDKSDVLYKYENHVMPAFNEFILPYKKTVDLVINNDNDDFKGPDHAVNYIMEEYGLNN